MTNLKFIIPIIFCILSISRVNALDSINVENIPLDYQLKVDSKADIINADVETSTEYNNKNQLETKTYIKYEYLEKLTPEINTEYGPNYRKELIGNTEYNYFYQTNIYTKINNEIFEIKNATTTQEFYDEQIKISFFEKILLNIFGVALAYDYNPITLGDNSLYQQDTSNWSSAYTSTTGTARNGNTNYVMGTRSDSSHYTIERSPLTFDTSALSDTCSKDTATLYLHGSWQRTAGITSQSYNVYGYNGDDTPDADDYNNCLDVAFSDSPITDSSWSTVSGLNTSYVLNSSGRSSISLTAKTKLCLRESQHDAINSAPTLNELGGVGYTSVRSTPQPMLTVTCNINYAPTYTDTQLFLASSTELINNSKSETISTIATSTTISLILVLSILSFFYITRLIRNIL